MTISFDLQEVEQFVTSDKFANFLTSETTDFGTAAFVLQVLLDKIEELKGVDIE